MNERGVNQQEARPLFVSTHEMRLTRFGATPIVRRAVAAATLMRPELARKSISPHIVRHYPPRRTMSGSRMMSHNSKGL